MRLITACVAIWCVGLSHQADCPASEGAYCGQSCDEPGYVRAIDTCADGVCCKPEECKKGLCVPEDKLSILNPKTTNFTIDSTGFCKRGEVCIVPEVCSGLCVPERARTLFRGTVVDVTGICVTGEVCLVIAPTKECGIKGNTVSSRRRKKRVVGGSTSVKCEYPWQVRVEALGSACGGSIIDEYTILTAASCLPSPDRLSPTNVKVDLGEYNLVDDSDQTSVTAASFHIHPDYSPSVSQNNLGIIKLKDPIQFNDCIAPICLPSADQDFRDVNCELSGWGSTVAGGPPSDILQTVTLPVVPYQDCRVSFGPVYVTEKNICAGVTRGGRDACLGDYGGPLACPSDGGYVLAGVSSWTDGCGEPGKPGVYTDVSKYLDWINGLSGAP